MAYKQLTGGPNRPPPVLVGLREWVGGGQAQKILSNNFFISADYKSAPKTALDAILKFLIIPPGGAQVPVSLIFEDTAK